MIRLVVDPAVLLVIMWIVARHNAELHFLTAFLVVVGVGVCSALLGALHPLVGLLGYIVILPLALVRLCCLSLKQAFIVTGLFAAWLISCEVIWVVLLR
jgi:hypothetical protein